MNRNLVWVLSVLLLVPAVVLAFEDKTIIDTVPAATVPKPLALKRKDKIQDSEKVDFPRAPQKDMDDSPLSVINDVDNAPRGPAILNLSDNTVFPLLEKVDKLQKKSGKYIWISAGQWNYCHNREDGNDWYGWKTGGNFHWVLLKNNHFWWRDNFAERWLYFYQGYWWWQSEKDPAVVQVFMDDGHYHACDSNGALGDDLWTTGVVQSITTPVAKPTANATPGHGHHGHRGGGGTMGGTNSLPNPSSGD